MDTTMSQWQTQFREGDDVIAADGEKLGSIQSMGANYLLVEKGFFFITDYYVPFSAVSSYDADGGKVYLSVTKDEALNSGWDVAPETTDRDITAAGGTMAAGGGAYAATDRDTPGWDAARTDRTRMDTDDHVTVPVHEEELTATKRTREAGDVQINKTVEAREETLEVPITEERSRLTPCRRHSAKRRRTRPPRRPKTVPSLPESSASLMICDITKTPRSTGRRSKPS